MEPDRAARAAELALDPPAELLDNVLDRLAALILQHDALRTLTVKELARTTMCHCRECTAATVEGLKALAAIERDQLRLETAGDLVAEVKLYEAPSQDEIGNAVRVHRHQAAVDHLERTFDGPPARGEA